MAMVALCSPRLIKRRLVSLSRMQALAVALTLGLFTLVALMRRRSDFIDSDSEGPHFYAEDKTHLHGRVGVKEDGHPTWKARRLKVRFTDSLRGTRMCECTEVPEIQDVKGSNT